MSNGNDPWAPEPGDPARPDPGGPPPAFPPPYPQPYPQQAYPQPYPYAAAPPPGGWGPRFDPADPLVSDNWTGWWQRGMSVVRRGWKTLLTLQLIGAVPLALLVVPSTIWSDRSTIALNQNFAQVDPSTGNAPDFGPFIDEVAGGLLLVALAAIVGGILYGVVHLATARAVVSIATGRPVSVGAELRAGLKRLFPLIGWTLLTTPIALVALLLCVLPVFYVGAVFMLLQAVVVFERTNAVSRCFQLFHTDLGAAAGRIATTWGLSLAIGLGLGVVATLITFGFTSPTDATYDGGNLAASLLSGAVQTVASIASGLVVTPLIVLAYTDLRARREPFTTDQLLATAA
ncbi:hypothetical protein [Spirilliplanes yamanashiensis]|uniref:Glycerophosphoryl diester phosphodiesterase membrane domain-containing protein n=1 Tax=Spirilliplanes yamanashiensis TaxID=42233 RepID=A0A8J4DL85_9ACTN|nr:hypothetical protein [Spirilliplanes yamanashiensis]MDP9816215.1 hypothetical protein [Spirilliplanes yamanashiensis]GIJ05741.1 hypothetical protein Sya03_50930 [Spirilliplanes yamanashiensis]